ncbi:bifunctional [glutamine synthetase] adenylyltransferase/[glutamine synthetase]-adenylyl-L-tyrosine phosphorylase [Acuticoccus sp. I52.16.1]|uniref:bifunctional [glutamine synthetase] adenylyltransferase/[glutamine synthetase]-adenylyl-L-tyrosine phosphorylase n=1 Tax=Acuticoccus sp. I52.16.1 TaxID=2928472 RepID=UPI001FD34D3B|nr:bifunctional [glutamine synthetase] adenylyltransferase/[glutamine synthetase]-adenylyl-L-tyrosine phosphorylase [Acuticoccus sp. I52.16.1]UOM34255.1 bifunctional [glutamine synthetase] adenylyltransferase/[glutamine synthetase]-adenylyl-L-tyrosine phosphorylase [Acuticoccus sp. I52.16.1]
MRAEAPLGTQLTPLPGPGDAQFDDAITTGAAASLSEGVRAALSTVASVSPFLKHLMLTDQPGLVAVLEQTLDATVTQSALEPSADLAAVGVAMRVAKRRVSLAVALADLLAGADVATVTGALSRTADAAIDVALRSVLLEAAPRGVAPDPDTCGIIVLAMGKLGGGELNYSSDVDLVVLTDPDRSEPAGIEPKRAVRLVQAMTRLLQERTAEGYVFRVDLRLRPDPGATPVAVSTWAAIAYYQQRARSWERQAMIKARQVTGDRAAGTAYLAAIMPSIWRAAYDFTIINDTMAMREQIAAVRGAGMLTIPGHNVKLGRGGIREIEFVVQSLQRIAGARDRRLRGRSTVAMLAVLARSGWLSQDACRDLTDAYEVLRRVEHRIQMVADEQTHDLPSEEKLPAIARMMRTDDLIGELTETFGTVHRHFGALSGTIGQINPMLRGMVGQPELPKTVSDKFEAAMETWTSDRYTALRSDLARKHLATLAPSLLAALGSTTDPEHAIEEFDAFLARLPRGVELLARLESHRELIPVLVLIVAAAPRLSGELARRSHLLDVLIDPTFFGRLPNQEELDTQLAAVLDAEPDYERKLDSMRTFGQEQALLIDVRILTGSLIGTEASHALSLLAEMLTRHALRIAAEEFATQHGGLPGGRVALVALGKFGSAEMTATSDLDLVFLYDCADDAGGSDGRRSLTPGHYYTRLAQRLIAALSAPTARGTLYEVDLRLRPDGRAGPIATQIRSFAAYHAESSWVWEHMALTRARVVAGDEALGEEALTIIRTALEVDPARETLAEDVAAMRARMAAEHGAGLKHMPGGQVDIDFVAQYLQLRHGLAAVGDDTSTASALARAREAEVIAGDDAEVLLSAHALYQRLSQILSIASENVLKLEEAPPALQRILTRAGDAPDIPFLVADLAERQEAVRALFERLVAPLPR